jgi:tetratricopeptide (TPR) repeat protein
MTSMKHQAKVAALVFVSALLMLSTGCNKLRARDQLNKGVQAYKSARFEQAIEHFKNSVDLDPGLETARLYLATAYMGQYVPGVDLPENKRNAELAIEQYQNVLNSDPKQNAAVLSLKGLAAIHFNLKEFEKAKEYHRKVLEKDPNDPETYYSIGVIDWTQAYQPRMEARNELGLKQEEPIKDKKVCEDLRAKNEQTVNEGINMLQRALELRQDYDDAMAYLNLMFREKADIACNDPAQRAIDLKTADEWVEKTMATKRAKAEKQQQATGGIVVDESK